MHDPVATRQVCHATCQLTLTVNLSIQVIPAVKQCHYPDQLDQSLTGLISIVLAWDEYAGQLAMPMQLLWVVSEEKLIRGKLNYQGDH